MAGLYKFVTKTYSFLPYFQKKIIVFFALALSQWLGLLTENILVRFMNDRYVGSSNTQGYLVFKRVSGSDKMILTDTFKMDYEELIIFI